VKVQFAIVTLPELLLLSTQIAPPAPAILGRAMIGLLA
jgi:hypothetical protein